MKADSNYSDDTPLRDCNAQINLRRATKATKTKSPAHMSGGAEFAA